MSKKFRKREIEMYTLYRNENPIPSQSAANIKKNLLIILPPSSRASSTHFSFAHTPETYRAN